MWKKMLQQKTTWAGLAYIATVAVPHFMNADIIAGLEGIIVGLAVIFMRQAVAKIKKSF